jgi:hypothetical protein
MANSLWRSAALAGLASANLAIVGCTSGPFPYSEAWYQERASDPPGSRQVEKHGKLWPPYPRPTGRSQTCAHQYHYSHYWPYPQICDDQAYVRNVLQMQSCNGWITATTLHDYHFNPESQQLTEGGRAHLLWIAQSVPPEHRVVYIAQGMSRDTAQLRIDAADEFYKEMEIQDPPAICARAEILDGRPAVEVQRIRELELQNIPKPRLFYIGSATAAGSTGSGGAAGAAAGAPTGSGAGSAGSTR